MDFRLSSDDRDVVYGVDIAYAVGCKDDIGAYGIIYGPMPTLRECLDFQLDDRHVGRPWYVIEFRGEPNGVDTTNRIVARWTSRGWVERKTSR